MRKILRGLLAAIPTIPVIIAVMVTVVYLVSYGELPSLQRLTTSIVSWEVLLYGLLVISTALLVRRKWAFIRRVRPLVRHGFQRDGEVIATRASTRTKAGVELNSLSIVVRLGDGSELAAAVEEPVGTELPRVSKGEPARVWSLDERSIVAAADGIFEAPHSRG